MTRPEIPGSTPRFQAAAEADSPGLASEFVAYLATTKKWWLTPIIVVLLAVAGLVALSGSVVRAIAR